MYITSVVVTHPMACIVMVYISHFLCRWVPGIPSVVGVLPLKREMDSEDVQDIFHARMLLWCVAVVAPRSLLILVYTDKRFPSRHMRGFSCLYFILFQNLPSLAWLIDSFVHRIV